MSQIYVPATASSPSVPTRFTADDGSFAVPTLNNVNVFTPGNGIHGIKTTASGSTITISLTDVIVSYVNVTGPTTYVVLPTDYFISCGTVAGPCTIQLPNNPTQYQQFVIKDRTGSAFITKVIVTTVGGVVTIDGNTSYTFTDDYESIQVIFNGTSYETF